MLTPALAALDETSTLDICRVAIAANLSNVRFLEHTIGGASITANLINVRNLRAHDWRSISRWLPTLLTFGIQSTRSEEHPSLPTSLCNVRYPEHTIGGASIVANLSNVRVLERTIRGASVAANLIDVRYLDHTIGGVSIAAKLSNVRVLEHTIGGASIAANHSNVRFLEHTSLLLNVWFAAAEVQWVCNCAGFQENTGQDMFLRRWPRNSGYVAS